MPEALRLPGYSPRYISYMSTAMASKTIAGVTVPDTPLITAALDLARKHLAEWSYNHVVRSWLLGFAIADRITPMANRVGELHAIADIVHDLGWDETDTFISKDKCFEVDGANAARAFIEQHAPNGTWDVHRKQLLWDAIALHTHFPVAQHKEPEVQATLLGIFADFTGPAGVPGGALKPEEFQEIAKAYPRGGFKTGVVQMFCGFCRNKPETTYNTIVGQFGDEMVDGYDSKGKRAFDIINAAVDTD